MAEPAKTRKPRKSPEDVAASEATPAAAAPAATPAAAPAADAPAASAKRPRGRPRKVQPAEPKAPEVKLPPSLLGTTIGSGMEFRPGASDNPPLPPPVVPEAPKAAEPPPPPPPPARPPMPTPPATLPTMPPAPAAAVSPAPTEAATPSADEIFGARPTRPLPPGEPVGGFNGFGGNNNGGGNGERHLSRRERWLERRRERQQREGQGGGNRNPNGGANGNFNGRDSNRRDRFQNGRDNRPQRPPLTPEEQAAREAQRAAAAAQAAAEAEERAKLALPLKLNDLQGLQMAQLKELADHFHIDAPGMFRKHEWIFEILKANARCGGTAMSYGAVDLVQTNHGLLRSPENNYVASPDDVPINAQIVRQWGLRTGDMVEVELRPPRDKEKFFAVDRVVKLNGKLPYEGRDVVPFENLRPVFPDERLRLEVASHNNINMRVMDLLTPIGKGQRGLIVAPPRTGKTVLMQMMANSISENNPEVRLIILLIDERPEEVTDMERNTKAEVISSTFDEAPERHAQIAELVIEMAKRQVEAGQDVVILLDSITRLARAYNTTAPHSGKILSGGIDANAMHMPKRFFGAARNIEGGGSLTIIATALVDTGSRMDEVIFEEFKGTGNMEVCLDRSLVDKRIFPAINIEQSGTRKEELLTYPDELARIWTLRKALSGVPSTEAMELLIGRLKKTRKNAEFLMTMNS